MKHDSEDSFSQEWVEIKKQLKQYICELAAAFSLIAIFFLLRNKAVPFFSNIKIDYYDLMVGFWGSALSLLFSLLVFLISTVGIPRFAVKLILHACGKNEVRQKTIEMTEGIYKVQNRWGQTVKGVSLYPSNTAEGLLAFASVYEADIYNIDENKLNELQKIATRCVGGLMNCFPGSEGKDRYTTQALSMQLLAVKRFEDLKIIQLNDQEKACIDTVIDHLLESADLNRGWGYFPFKNYSTGSDSAILIVPTLWALRAVNAWRKGSDERFEKILSRLPSKTCQVGFKPNSEPRFSATALYLTLLSELRDSEMRKKYGNTWEKVASKLMNSQCPETEVEISYYIGYQNKLKANYWIHLSRCLVMEAAICNRNKLTIRQALWLRKTINTSLSQVHKYYHVHDLPCSEEELPIYPSFYLISALARFLKK